MHQLPSVCAWGTLHSRGEGTGQPDDERPGERLMYVIRIMYIDKSNILFEIGIYSITFDSHKIKDKMIKRPRRRVTR